MNSGLGLENIAFSELLKMTPLTTDAATIKPACRKLVTTRNPTAPVTMMLSTLVLPSAVERPHPWAAHGASRRKRWAASKAWPKCLSQRACSALKFLLWRDYAQRARLVVNRWFDSAGFHTASKTRMKLPPRNLAT
jgi:hypothetical protein